MSSENGRNECDSATLGAKWLLNPGREACPGSRMPSAQFRRLSAAIAPTPKNVLAIGSGDGLKIQSGTVQSTSGRTVISRHLRRNRRQPTE